MKKINLLLAFMFISLFAFAQSSRTSVSLVDGDKTYCLNAKYSTPMYYDLKAFINAEITSNHVTFLENRCTWTGKKIGLEKWYIELRPNKVKATLNKNLLSKKEFREMQSLLEAIGEMISESGTQGEEKSAPKAADVSCDVNHDTEIETGPNYNIDLNVNGRKILSNVIDTNHKYCLNSKHIEDERSEIIEKITEVLGEVDGDSRRNSAYWTLEKNGVVQYEFYVGKNDIEIFINKIALNETEADRYYKLARSVAKRCAWNGTISF